VNDQLSFKIVNFAKILLNFAKLQNPLKSLTIKGVLNFCKIQEFLYECYNFGIIVMSLACYETLARKEKMNSITTTISLKPWIPRNNNVVFPKTCSSKSTTTIVRANPQQSSSTNTTQQQQQQLNLSVLRFTLGLSLSLLCSSGLRIFFYCIHLVLVCVFWFDFRYTWF